MKISNHIISDEEMIEKFMQYVNEHKGDGNFKKGSNLLSKLLKEIEHPLSSIINRMNIMILIQPIELKGYLGTS